ncbi:hypothetical protein ACQ4PT_036005 [Festuca glaucescens]
MADEAALLLGVPREVEFIRSELQMMQSSAACSDGGCCKDTVRTCVKQVRNLACDLEDCLLDFTMTMHASRGSWLQCGGGRPRRTPPRRRPDPPPQGQPRGAQPAQPAVQRLRRRHQRRRGAQPAVQCLLFLMKRCLVVVDDVSSQEEWELISRCLGAKGAGSSLVVVTTRREDVRGEGLQVQARTSRLRGGPETALSKGTLAAR